MSRRRSRVPWISLVALAATMLALGGGPAGAVVTAYRWQVQQSGTIGSSGYTANWPAACGGQPDVDNNVAPIVTTMSTAAYCGDDRFRNRRPGGPHDLILMIKDTAYATATTVTGQATGNRWAMEDAGGGGKTVRFTLGYAQGGTFTGWGSVDVVIPDGVNDLYLPDMSTISGTAPSGSHLALLITKQVGDNNSRLNLYFADLRQGGDQSGQISVDEAAAGNTTTLGDGTDPAAASLCPGDAETIANQFTFVTDGNTDAVNDVTVSLSPAGSFANLSQVRITTTGGSPLGTVNNPSSTTLVIPLTGLDATTTETPYEVRFTPKTHAAMDPPASGLSYDITAPITAFTPASNSTAGSDNDTEATTVDNASPANAGWGTITPGDGQITLAWSDPADADFAEVIIVRKEGGSIANLPTEGQTYVVGNFLDPGPDTEQVVFVGTDAASPWTDTGVTNGQSYWYKIFARDNPCVNWSTGAETGPWVPAAPANEVTPGVPTATSVLCDSVTISAPYSGDSNGNSTTDFARKASTDCSGGGYSAVPGCTGVTGASPRTCVDTTVAEVTDYCYQVTFNDVDGVLGTNPQTVGPVTTLACAADDTTVVSNTADDSSCSQITTTSQFSGDDNDNGSTLVEFRTPPGSGAWTTACSALTGASPRQCLVTGLSESTSYELQFTFSDADGVTGTNPDTATASTPACGGDQAAPTLLMLSPARDAVLSGTDRVKVQVYDLGLASVECSVDGGTFSAATVNGNYSCGTGCAVYECDIDTTALTNGSHYFTVRALDSETTPNEALLSRGFRVNNLSGNPGGAGSLLRRTPGSQLCIDCHNIPTHSSQTTSTSKGNWAIECLTCHTPHRTTNIYLIREELRTPSSGKKTILFHFDDQAGETNPGSAPGDYSFLGDRSGGSNTPYDDGVCEACHTKTSHWRNDTSGGDHTHNAAVRCLRCHLHAEGFRGSGECLDCHATAGQQGTTGANNRRPVEADFSKNSHHVGVAGATNLTGTLTSFDCVVCHAEGKIDAGGAVTTTAHHNDGLGLNGNHRIDLKDTDNWSDAAETGYFSYDKYAVCMSITGNDDTACRAAGGGGSTALPGSWHSGDSEWRTQTSTGLDPFCLTCHDTDGATASANQNTDEGCSGGGDALNPFCDDAITNDYDQRFRNPADPLTGPGRVVDIASRVVATSDLDGDGIADPPQGIYARHAIRGQSLSRYDTYTLSGTCDTGNAEPCRSMRQGDTTAGQSLLVDLAASDAQGPLWNDTSVMGCADCHTVDGANASAGNAHGSDSEYLLKDSTGGATEGIYDGSTTFTYICYRCHVVGRYVDPGVDTLGQHTDKDSDWADTTGSTGSARNSGDGNIFGMACTNCHGGTNFGTIHGTSETLGVGQNGGAGTRPAYRFTNGASLRYFDPGSDWSDQAISCWTLSGSGDNWGSCTQHGGSPRNWDKPLARPLDYTP